MTEDRSYYLNDYADEIMPCNGDLTEWAKWLSQPCKEWNRTEAAKDGDAFEASATLWEQDIIATRQDGAWTLSRSPTADFVAVRYGCGMGWPPDNIISPEGTWDDETGDYTVTETMEQAVLRWLTENDEYCDDHEFIAVGAHESNWRVTYHVDPARCTAERVQ